MKIHFAFTFLLLTALVLQRVTALPQPLGIGQIFGNIIEVPRLAFVKLNEFAENGIKNTLRFADHIRADTKSLFKKVQNLSGQFRNIIASNSKRFWHLLNSNSDDNPDSINLKKLNETKHQLESLLTELESLQNLAHNIRNAIKADTTQYEDLLQAEWNAFATEQLTRIEKETKNTEKNERIEQLINLLVNRYGNYINACVEEYEQSGKKYEENTNNFLQKHQPYIEELLDQVDDCVLSDMNNKFNKTWQENLEKEMQKLSDIPNVLKKFREEGKNILHNAFTKRSCVISTLAEFEKEKQETIKKLRTIVNENS